MAEYIEREAAIEAMKKAPVAFMGTVNALMDLIEDIPAADVRPVVRAKWIYDHWCEFKCSNCGAWSESEPYRGRENFCPNCGADMREES